jgi:acetyltransferase-like isoleucine patch superfamily enzyme
MKIAASAQVSPQASVAESATIWDLAQVREHAVIGENVILGRAVYIGSGVLVGDDCKIQNLAQIYEPATLGEGVFVGPGAILTNDKLPRAINESLVQKNSKDWTPVGVTVEVGASIGAGSVCVAPVNVGRWAMIAAGAVVTDDVADFALVAGVPARRIGWVGKTGKRLTPLESAGPAQAWICPDLGEKYVESHGSGIEGVKYLRELN